MAEVNEGVQIILNRMESNPEEFFGEQSKWRWIFGENLRDVMTEPEKAALYEGMKKVRRLEITAKAVATVMPTDEEDDEKEGLIKKEWLQPQPKKMIVNRAQAEMIKKFSGSSL
jgi:hypothetical protein